MTFLITFRFVWNQPPQTKETRANGTQTVFCWVTIDRICGGYKMWLSPSMECRKPQSLWYGRGAGKVGFWKNNIYILYIYIYVYLYV